MFLKEFGLLFRGELDVYNSAFPFEIVLEARWSAAMAVEPSTHLGHFERKIDCGRQLDDYGPHPDLTPICDSTKFSPTVVPCCWPSDQALAQRSAAYALLTQRRSRLLLSVFLPPSNATSRPWTSILVRIFLPSRQIGL